MSILFPAAYIGEDPYIFISYAHRDSEKILPIIDGLQKRGFRVWYDEGLEVGSSWGDKIEEHLYNCNCAVCFITESFLKSANCQDEIDYAKEIGKGPLIIYMETLELPRGFQFRYNRFHALKYQDFGSLEHFLDKLCSTTQLAACRHEDAPVAAADQASEQTKPTPQEYLKLGNQAYASKDYENAVEYYRTAAIQGYAKAQVNLGLCYERGKGLPRNRNAAIMWYKQAAEQNHLRAMYLLGEIYCYGWHEDWDFPEGVKWFRKAAEQGHPESQWQLGLRYYYGQGVPEDHTQAVYWFQKAADQGSDVAQHNLARAYEQGDGVPCDLRKAAQWYRKAAEQGYSPSQYELGGYYEFGTGVAQDRDEAIKWYRKAAEQGDSSAKSRLLKLGGSL